MSKIKSGFSLLELMVVVAIIGVLTSIAVPAYRKNQVSARMQQVVQAFAPYQQMIQDYQTNGGGICDAALGSQLGSIQTSAPVNPAFWYFNGTVPGCYVELYMNGPALGAPDLGVSNTSLSMRPSLNSDGSIQWTCHNWDGTGGALLAPYIPASCR